MLSCFRIPGRLSETTPKKKAPVLFWHGLFNAADSFIVNSDNSPAFLAASQGYDVWLGNGRGNSYSRKHLQWDPDKDKSQYWNFSWQHSANDIPATLEYIVNLTGFQKVAYIGHSQGTTQLFANLPINQEYYKDRISVFIALGPIARLSSTKSPAFNALSYFYV